MSRKILLWIAAFLTLFTFIGHSIGGIFGPGSDQPIAYAVYETMKMTTVEMPFGPARSFSRMMVGSNIIVSFFLLVCGLIFILLSKGPATDRENKILMITAAGTLGIGIVSTFCFFPLPALCTVTAGALGIVASRKA